MYHACVNQICYNQIQLGEDNHTKKTCTLFTKNDKSHMSLFVSSELDFNSETISYLVDLFLSNRPNCIVIIVQITNITG